MAMTRFVCVLIFSESARFLYYFKPKVVLAVEKKQLERLDFLIKVVTKYTSVGLEMTSDCSGNLN
jgi:hypothetical protein